MTWNVFKAWTSYRKKKRQMKELKQFSKVFSLMQQLEKCELMRYDNKLRRLYIMEPLAQVQMRSAEAWRGFMTNVFLWQQYLRQQEAWDNYILNEELKAVRRARRKVAVLTKADTERVRRARREEITMTDIQPPKPQPYEVMIIRDATDKEGKAVADIIAVAAFDPETEQIVVKDWEEVKDKFNNNNEK